MALKTRKTILALCVLAFFAITIVTLLYGQGYSLDNNFRISQRGGLYVSLPFDGAEIFVNNKKENASGMLSKGLFMSNLKTGEYSILVAKENFWPWIKKLEVKQGLVTESMAILIPKNPQGGILFKGKFTKIWASPDQNLLVLKEERGDDFQLTFYLPGKNTFLTTDNSLAKQLLSFKKGISNIIWSKNSFVFKSEKGTIEAKFNLAEEIVSASYFTENLPQVSDFEKFDKKKNEKIWWDDANNEIFADWLKKDALPPYYICPPQRADGQSCQLPALIFKSNFRIKNIEFFPDRKDIIIMAAGNGIYVVEMDGRSERLVYPIYKGKDPTFAISTEKNFIYAIDDGALIKMSLE
ncbi:hypothetical protein KKB69_02380 [Patescibacteria group bacterium]|nr:hypothetical protein [Patescibacteria group bacterium]